MTEHEEGVFIVICKKLDRIQKLINQLCNDDHFPRDKRPSLRRAEELIHNTLKSDRKQ